MAALNLICVRVNLSGRFQSNKQTLGSGLFCPVAPGDQRISRRLFRLKYRRSADTYYCVGLLFPWYQFFFSGRIRRDLGQLLAVLHAASHRQHDRISYLTGNAAVSRKLRRDHNLRTVLGISS